ncbi:MAG: hypothetical protein ACI4A3_13390 [Lachnospiraceae bacterium]
MQIHFNNWLVYFYFYCICGWIFESTYVSIRTHKLTNRGFMKGPWLPLYGTGAIIVLVATLPFQQYPVAVYFAGAIAATILEYFTGVAMVKLFKVRYWDYSNQKIQFQGHICLSSSVAWGFLSLLMVYVVHKPVAKFIAMWNEDVLNICTFLITILMVYDFANAFREAMDLRALIIQAEDIRKRLNEALDEQKERFEETVEERKEQFAQSVEERKEQFTQTVEEKKEQLTQSVERRKEQLAQSVEETREQLNQVAEERKVHKEEVSNARKERRQEASAARRERLEGTIAELEAASENLRKNMEKHSSQLLLHNPGSSFFGMKEESGEIRKRLLERRKK